MVDLLAHGLLERTQFVLVVDPLVGEVAQLLGAPLEVVQLGYRSAWRYEFTVEKQAALFLFVVGLRGVDNQADRVWVFFDEEGVVSHVGATFAGEDAEYSVPGVEVWADDE